MVSPDMEQVRGDHGDVTVLGITRDPGTFRVYNMTIEADHDYYVGDLTALVHNDCPGFNGSEARRVLEGYKNYLKSQLAGRQIEAFKKMVEDYKIGEQYLDNDTLYEMFEEIKKTVNP